MLFRPSALLLFTALGALWTAAERTPVFVAPAAAAVFSEVASFPQPPYFPASRLLLVPADGNYYGVTSDGGVNSLGAIFRVTPSGAMTTLVSFTGDTGAAKGAAPDAGLVLGMDGALYGTTTQGGTLGYGTIFKVTTSGTFTTLVEFNYNNGSVPGELVLAGDGNFYGTTQGGGQNGCGTVFALSVAGTPTLTTRVHFTGISGTRRGDAPVGALVPVGSTLYGVTRFGGSGGTLNLGTIYRVNTNGNSFATLVEFSGIGGTKPGSMPAAGMCLHPDGALYGTVEFGGANGTNDFGGIFRLTIAQDPVQYEVIRFFAGADGDRPAGALVVGSDGLLYGTTSAGGLIEAQPSSFGTAFKIAVASPITFTKLVDFTGVSGAKPGASSRAGLIAIGGGEFVGTTNTGGAGNLGTCFKVNTTGTFTNLSHFTTSGGWTPAGGVVFNFVGDMFVPLRDGGGAGFGTLKRVLANGTSITEASFGHPLGEVPAGGLLDLSGEYFGVTKAGGSTGRGTFFRYLPGSGATHLASCPTGNSESPEGPPTLGADGHLYVATNGSGSNHGAVMRCEIDGSLATIVAFSGVSGTFRGTRPRGPLAVDAAGNFYGVTEAGGTHDKGTAFKITNMGVFSTLFEFGASGTAPASPLGGLVAGPDGNFYGTTSEGGSSDHGTVFRLPPGGAVTVLTNFTNTSGTAPGRLPLGPLLAALDGTLYGTTSEGGASGRGTIFRINPAGTYSLLYAFTGIGGSVRGETPEGGLVLGPDGGLYGTAAGGGTGSGGNVFRVQELGPHAGTDAPTFVPGTTTLRGRAQSGGEVTSVWFQYGPTAALGSSTTMTSVPANGSPGSFSTQMTGLTPGATIYYRARAANTHGNSSGLIRSFVVPDAFGAWNFATFGSTNVSGLEDADGDGGLNLTEYALLTAGAVCDRASQPCPSVKTYAEGQRLSLILRRDPIRNDVTIHVQAASSPTGPWTNVATSSLGAPFSGPGYVSGDSATAGIKTVEIRDVVNMAGNPSRFLRVQVVR